MLKGMTRWQRIPAWLAIAVVAVAVATTSASAKPGQPGASDYVLELRPFAEHAGQNAMDLTFSPDGTARVFVSTQSGQVFAFAEDGEPLGTFLDLTTANVGFAYEDDLRVPFKGLMYIAFHPGYADTDSPGHGRFYTVHQVTVSSEAPDYNTQDFGGLGDTDVRFMLAQWQADPDNPDRIDPASHRRVMLLHFVTYNHQPHAIGEIAFNPYARPGDADYGNLYIAVGDGHNGDYKNRHNLARTQQADNPFAKILRINPLESGESAYTIPEDNPFVIEGKPTEAYAIGLRDAQTFCFAKDLDGQTVLLAFDIGALLVEEVNIVRPGGNYGWDRYEGSLFFNKDRQALGSHAPPAAHYGHAFPTRLGDPPTGGPAAIIGGFVVSDPTDPSFQGQVLFADLPRGTFMHAPYHHMLTGEGGNTPTRPYIIDARLADSTNDKTGNKIGNFADLVNAPRGDTRFGTDSKGNIYIVSKQTNTIYKTNLVNTGQPVKADPKIKSSNDRPDYAMLVIIGVTLFLVLELAWVWRRKKG